jgi:hypothetical protein
MSNAKLGLLIFWPTFWTGFPIKLIFCLLLLAAHVPPWESSGLFMLLVVSIPVDIWALGLCARTVFFDRLKVDPQPGLGIRLWVRWAVFSAVVLPLIMTVVASVADVTRAASNSIIESIKESVYPTFPVAEQISLELVMWGSVSTVVLLALVYGWLFGLGWLTQAFVKSASPLSGNIEERTHFWDRLRIPADQPLLLMAFTGVGVVLVFIFWGILPASTPHPHPEYEFISPPVEAVRVDPLKVIKQAEQVVMKAEMVVEKLEQEKTEGNPQDISGGKEIQKEKKTQQPGTTDSGASQEQAKK